MSGRNGGGSEYTRSRTELGAKKLRWVSKKPTDMKNGSGIPPPRASIAAGATELTVVFSMSCTTS